MPIIGKTQFLICCLWLVLGPRYVDLLPYPQEPIEIAPWNEEAHLAFETPAEAGSNDHNCHNNENLPTDTREIILRIKIELPQQQEQHQHTDECNHPVNYKLPLDGSSYPVDPNSFLWTFAYKNKAELSRPTYIIKSAAETTTPETTTPETTEPETTEPETTEPETTEPDTTEPDTTETDSSEEETETEPTTTTTTLAPLKTGCVDDCP